MIVKINVSIQYIDFVFALAIFLLSLATAILLIM